MDYQAMYAEKRKTPEEAVSIIRDGDWVDYGQTCSYPHCWTEPCLPVREN